MELKDFSRLMTMSTFEVKCISAATAQAPDVSIPAAEKRQQVVNEACAKFKDVKDGKDADYLAIPILATVTQGQLYSPDSPPSDVRVTTTPALTLTCTKLTEPQSAIRVEP